MKSLLIVNRNIKSLKKQLYKLGDVQEGTVEHFEQFNLAYELKEQLTIKQDLEVLQILRKKNVYFQGLKYAIENLKSNDDVLCFYNFVRKEEEQLTMEELLKIKQWLEVNE